MIRNLFEVIILRLRRVCKREPRELTLTRGIRGFLCCGLVSDLESSWWHISRTVVRHDRFRPPVRERFWIEVEGLLLSNGRRIERVSVPAGGRSGRRETQGEEADACDLRSTNSWLRSAVGEEDEERQADISPFEFYPYKIFFWSFPVNIV